VGKKVDKEKEKNSSRARAEVLTPDEKRDESSYANSPTTLNGCPLSMMLRPFLISAVVAVPARTCSCACA
jgi:hypothetical protein